MRPEKKSAASPRTTTFRSSSIAVSILAFCITASIANAEQHATLTHHVRQAAISGRAARMGSLPGTTQLNLAIMLPLRHEADLDQLLLNAAEPEASGYREPLSVKEFTASYGPTQQDYDKISRFAEANNLTIVATSANRIVLDVRGSAADIEKAFHLSIGVYQHPTENRTFYAPDREPTLDLDVPLWHISGLDNYSRPHPLYKHRPVETNSTSDFSNPSPLTGSGPGRQYLGSDMRAAYYGSGPLDGTGQSVGLFEFLGYELSDVTLYFQTVNQPLNVAVKGVSVKGAKLGCPAKFCDDTEQDLDIVQAISMAPAMTEALVYVGNNDVDIFNQMATDNIAKQLSCSWGWDPVDSNIDDPIFKEFAAQGQNLFAASGDNGAYVGTNKNNDDAWPADDANLVSVGATHLVTQGAGGPWDSEIAWNFSGGGPSPAKLKIPAYQQLAGVINSSNRGSTAYRNAPDVAAEGDFDNFVCSDGSCSGGWAGTSFAAPRWAGFMALINQQAVANGRKPLGFLNPLIYRIGIGSNYDSDFHDITSGNNTKFNAVVGYDLVDGWGSMNGSNLIDALAGNGK